MEEKRNFKLYNNGVKTIRVYEGENPPEGFVLGMIRNTPAWNKGKTAETDPRVKANGQATKNTRLKKGNYIAWNKGLTKEDDPRLSGSSGEKNGMYGKHRVAWNKGITAKTDERMQLASNNHKGCTAWNKSLKGVQKWTEDQAEKYWKTRMKNNSFNNIDTKAERLYLQYLLTRYCEDDIIHPYYDKERYPFKCDFYIKSENKFIEVHANWTHGGRPYDLNDPDCQKQLKGWEEKAKTSQFYANAIYTWTDLDVRKAETAKRNNLNFEAIYS